MLRRSTPARFNEAPQVFPFHKPFLRTPYDEDRHKMRRRSMYRPTKDEQEPPQWQAVGINGTGHGVGLHRTHPLSPLRGNLQQTPENVPRIFQAVTQGFRHDNGNRLYYRGGKVPQPQMQPYLTGEPCPVHGWKITDHEVTRKFEAPIQDKEKVTYKPYVALQEQQLYEETLEKKPAALPASSSADGGASSSSSPPAPVPDKPAADGGAAKGGKTNKPLLKRLFFWQ